MPGVLRGGCEAGPNANLPHTFLDLLDAASLDERRSARSGGRKAAAFVSFCQHVYVGAQFVIQITLFWSIKLYSSLRADPPTRRQR